MKISDEVKSMLGSHGDNEVIGVVSKGEVGNYLTYKNTCLCGNVVEYAGEMVGGMAEVVCRSCGRAVKVGVGIF